MKVFIWGCYNQGNFGDDLMGIIFSKLFQKEGCEILCYRLSSSLSEKYAINTTDSVEDAMKWCDIVIIGGGAFFKQEHETHQMINDDLKALNSELKLHKKKLYCISVGSDNVSTLEQLYSPRRDIIESDCFMGGSVRIKGDLDKFNFKKTIFIEDIILTLPVLYEFLGIEHVKQNSILYKKNVINFSKKNFIKSLLNIRLWRSLSRSVYFKSHDSASGITSEANLPFIPFYENKDPIESSFALAEAKSVISTKLHVGVAACSFGVGFKSVYGNDKTKVFLSQSADFLDIKDGFYSLNDIDKQKSILNEYIKLISEIVLNNK